MPEGIGERRRVAAASESAAAACSATARCLRSPPCCGPHGRRMGTGGRASLPRALHGCPSIHSLGRSQMGLARSLLPNGSH